MQDNVLKEIEYQTNFLNPYLKQFKNHLKGNKIIEINGIDERYLDNLTSLELDATILSDLNLKTVINDDKLYDGVVILNPLSNLSETDILILFAQISQILNNDGLLFLVNNIKYYDKDILNLLSKKEFSLIEEFIGDANWNFLLYQKNTIK